MTASKIEVVVTGKDVVAEGVVELRLRALRANPLPEWGPGAHVDLWLPNGMMRKYSLHGDPADRENYTISVLREAGGRGGSAYLHDRVPVGAQLTITGPRNNFPLCEAEQYLFIAGGIGITPILPMARQVLSAGAGLRLIYGGRSRASMAYLNQLAEFRGVEIRPQDEYGLLDVAGILDDWPAEQPIYCCGPSGLIEAVQRTCTATQARNLHLERFAATTANERPTENTENTENTEFELVLNQSGTVLTIPADKSIMDVMLQQTGIDPFSCGEGDCGTCEVAVLEGTPDHRDSILSDGERVEGRVMYLCVGRSYSPRLVVDL